MKNAKHLVIVEEDAQMLEMFVEACGLIGYRYTVVPFPIIRQGRAASFISTLTHVDAVIVASYFPSGRLPKGDQVIASIHATCPDLCIIGCGGDARLAQAMHTAGARAFAIRGMRAKVTVLFETINKHVGQANTGVTTPLTPDQK